MTNNTIYDHLVGKYVRVMFSSGVGLGKLKAVDFNSAVLNPCLIRYDTPFGDGFGVVNDNWAIPYGAITGGIQPLGENGETYMRQLVEETKVKDAMERAVKLEDFKSKKTGRKDIEDDLEKMANAVGREKAPGSR